MKQNHQTGFTLIELSIVLVIIGLIVGGVLVGRDLIKTATLRKVISGTESLKTAYNTYRLKYNAWPGDHAEAQVVFGAVNCPDWSIVNKCNGNGNGLISSDSTDNFETYAVMRHLSLAGLIPGTFTGNYGDPPSNLWLYSSISQAVYRITSNYQQPNSIYGFVGNYIALGDPATFFTAGPVLNVPDAYYIDLKADDGRASSGKVFTKTGTGVTAPGCLIYPGYSYNLSIMDIKCTMQFSLE